MKNKFLILAALAACLSLSSCMVKDNNNEPSIIIPPATPPDNNKEIPDELGNMTLGYDDGKLIRLGNSNIFSLLIKYPQIEVTSSFGNIVAAPKIIYLGEYESLDEVPLQTEGQFKYDKIDIHNKGGYIVKLTSYMPSSQGQANIFMKLYVLDKPGATVEQSKVEIDYALYTKSN